MKDAKSDFTQDDLVKYWIEYANNLTIEKIHLKNTLISCKPVLKDNYSFEISVYNPSQRDETYDSNANILGFLSNKLNNNQIKMDILIVEKGEIEMIYTAAEKYEYLSKKNPNIEKLKELFNLIIE
jgi:DNA polymerase-3 subunit gamma/tau